MLKSSKTKLEQKDLFANTREYKVLQSEMARIQQENKSAKEEVNEVLQALEQLVAN